MSIPFVVPAEWQMALKAGRVIRRGALLINAEGGGIVAHLQETAGLANVATGLLNPVSSVIQAATGVVTIVQNEQIKRGIGQIQQTLGTVQMLQVATLASSLVGIGVSAAGTMLVLKRLNGLKKDLDMIVESIAAFREDWEMSKLRELIVVAETRIERIEEARGRRDEASVLGEAEGRLHDVFDALRDRATLLLRHESVPLDALKIVLNGLAVSGNARIRSLFLLDEPAAARDAAMSQLRHLASLTRIGPRDVLERRLAGPGDVALAAQEVSTGLSEMRERVESVPRLIDHLAAMGQSPRGYLDEVGTAEDDLLLLPVTAAK